MRKLLRRNFHISHNNVLVKLIILPVMSARDHKNQTLTPLIKERKKLSNTDLEDYKIRVPKVPFVFFDKLKNKIQNSILRF